MEKPAARGNQSRWATVAVTVAPIFIALLLAALVVIPAITHARYERAVDDVSQLAEPARYLLDTLALTTGVQSRAARAGLTFPEQRSQYALMHEEATRTQKNALEELLALTGALDERVHRSAERLQADLETWQWRQQRFLDGEMSLEEYRRALPAQDELFDEVGEEWQRCARMLQRFSEKRRQEGLVVNRAESRITSALAGAALVTLLLVLWLAHRGRSLEAALSRQRLAEKAASARAEVLAQVSHDLRSPLTAITTSSAAIRRVRVGPDPLLERALDRIESASRRMTRLVGDLLDQARLSSGEGLGMDAYDIDIVPIILRCREEASPERPARVQCHVDEQARRVIADPDRLEQVLVNLLNNALKFSPPGTPVHVEVNAEGDEAVFRVRDHGPGISAEDRPHLFQAFWQSTEVRRPGYGLGLAIARAIVEGHGGRIWLDDTSPERGSTFAFCLPRA